MKAGCRLLLLLLCVSGCRTGGSDVLENELRKKDVQYRELLDDFTSTEARNETLQRENEALRKGAKITPEQAAATFGVKNVTLGRGTGGIDEDKKPGDEAIVVVVEPRDHDDHVIKVNFTLEVLVLEISPQGVKCPIGSWSIGAEELRKAYKQSLFSTGYQVTLPWKLLPQYENLRVAIRFKLPDGRIFDADKDVKVKLIPGAALQRQTEQPQFLPAPSSEGPGTLGILQASYAFPAPQRPASIPRPRPASLDGSVTIGRATPLPDPEDE